MSARFNMHCSNRPSRSGGNPRLCAFVALCEHPVSAATPNKVLAQRHKDTKAPKFERDLLPRVISSLTAAQTSPRTTPLTLEPRVMSILSMIPLSNDRPIISAQPVGRNQRLGALRGAI